MPARGKAGLSCFWRQHAREHGVEPVHGEAGLAFPGAIETFRVFPQGNAQALLRGAQGRGVVADQLRQSLGALQALKNGSAARYQGVIADRPPLRPGPRRYLPPGFAAPGPS
jgi:hypothetical protein